MGKRRQKKRTHVKPSEDEVAKTPRSMVLKMGDQKREVTNALAQLVRDFRMVMQPHTAARLKERKSNRLRDFVTMAGPLGVTHLFIFSTSLNNNTTLRICRTPRGPTLNFRVKSYSLCKDVRQAIKTPKSFNDAEYRTPPLLVLNNFSQEQDAEPKEALLTSMFQNMFPPISAQATKVSSIKRVLMLNKDPDTGEIELRHYSIETKQVEGSKPVRKLSTVEQKVHKKLPNLSQASDISDYILDPYGNGGYTSESEVEEDAMVEVDRQPTKRKEKTPGSQKKAIKLVEIGPRLRLELRKIEEGICDGKTLYHAFVEKSKTETKELEKRHQQRQSLKEQRRKEQESNVQKKKDKNEAKISRTKRGILKSQEKEDQPNDDDDASDNNIEDEEMQDVSDNDNDDSSSDSE